MNPNCSTALDRKVCSDYSVESLVNCSRKRRISDSTKADDVMNKRIKLSQENEAVIKEMNEK